MFRVKAKVTKRDDGLWRATVRTSWWSYAMKRDFTTFDDALQGAIDAVSELIEENNVKSHS